MLFKMIVGDESRQIRVSFGVFTDAPRGLHIYTKSNEKILYWILFGAIASLATVVQACRDVRSISDDLQDVRIP